MTKLWDIYEVGSGFAVEDRFTAKRHSYHRTLEEAEKALRLLQAKGAVVITHPAPKSKSKPKAKQKPKSKSISKAARNDIFSRGRRLPGSAYSRRG